MVKTFPKGKLFYMKLLPLEQIHRYDLGTYYFSRELGTFMLIFILKDLMVCSKIKLQNKGVLFLN